MNTLFKAHTAVFLALLTSCADERVEDTSTEAIESSPTVTEAVTSTGTPAATPTPTEAATPTGTPAATPTPTEAATPTATAEPTPTQTASPLPIFGPCPEGSDMDADLDQHPDACEIESVLVPAGPFVMGSDSGDPYTVLAETPEHEVLLSAYQMDLHEVTNRSYLYFLQVHGSNLSEDGEALIDLSDDDWSRLSMDEGGAWELEGGYLDHPVEGVTWFGAVEYCAFMGKRLPTEAEWEKAARGGCEVGGDPELCEDPEDERNYPWGTSSLSCGKVNAALDGEEDCVGTTVPVMSYPSNASPYGVLDMLGNVAEWVHDLYGYDYYQQSWSYEWIDPQGPETGGGRSYRGGAWWAPVRSIRVSDRAGSDPGDSEAGFGFRCASDI